jgi:hypothetical protein
MQANNLYKVVNFITARIFEPNANDLLNSSYGKELFCAIGMNVDVKELEVDIEGVKQRLAKYIPNANIASIREFEVVTFDDECSDTQFFYELKLNCVLNRWDGAGNRIEESAQHTFYFRLVSNYPNMGYRLEEDFNYKNNEWMSEDGNLSLVVGWKYVACGAYYIHV